MKQLSVSIFFVVCLVMAGFSQRFEGGLLAGLNASQVDGDTYSGYHKPGIVAGAYVLTNLSQTVFSGMEIKFSQKGSRKNPDPKIPDDPSKYIMRLNYIDLPVYIGIRTSERTSILGGLSAGYLMKGTEYNNYGAFVKEDQHPFNNYDIQCFLGFRFQMTDRFYIDLRGAYSILPIRESPGEVLSYWRDSQFSNLLNTTIIYRLDF